MELLFLLIDSATAHKIRLLIRLKGLMSSHRRPERYDRNSYERPPKRRPHSSHGTRMPSSYDSGDLPERTAHQAATRAVMNRDSAEQDSAPLLVTIQAQLAHGFGVTQNVWQMVSELPKTFRNVLTEELSVNQQHSVQVSCNRVPSSSEYDSVADMKTKSKSGTDT